MSFGLANRVFSPLRNALDDDARDGAAFDPIDTMIGLSEALRGPGGGVAGLTRSGVQKELLVRHFMQHYQMIVGSLLTWRQLPDWSDEALIPSWVATGVSS
jgi:hypothetical protein